MSLATERTARIAALHEAAARRILVLDGSWGAKIQDLRLTEEQFRGERFGDHSVSLRGNTDLLCLTRTSVVCELLEAYLAAGADITSTNTFTATTIAQADYDTQHLVVEINHEAARLSREVADRFTAADQTRPRWVAGSIGPTNRTLSLSPDVEDPGARAVDRSRAPALPYWRARETGRECPCFIEDRVNGESAAAVDEADPARHSDAGETVAERIHRIELRLGQPASIGALQPP